MSIILAPDVFVNASVSVGTPPEQVVQLLSDNYTAVAQTANLMADMLISAGKMVRNIYKYLTNQVLTNPMDCHILDGILRLP